MYKLIEFLRSISLLLLFLTLEVVAILLYAHSNSYTQAKIVGLTSSISGAIGDMTGGVGDYFSLREENDMLLRRIMELEGELHNARATHSDSLLAAHSVRDHERVKYVAANVVRNTTNRSKNIIIINRGYESGVRERMAVTTPRGEVVGSVVACTGRYAVVMSLLNRDFHSSGKVKGDSRVGALSWNGLSRYRVQLTELSKYANIYEGGEVITTGLSKIFPEGLKIGRVAEYTFDDIEGAYSAEVELSADMSALDEVIVINSVELGESWQVEEDFNIFGKLEVEQQSEIVLEVDDMLELLSPSISTLQEPQEEETEGADETEGAEEEETDETDEEKIGSEESTIEEIMKFAEQSSLEEETEDE